MIKFIGFDNIDEEEKERLITSAVRRAVGYGAIEGSIQINKIEILGGPAPSIRENPMITWTGSFKRDTSYGPVESGLQTGTWKL